MFLMIFHTEANDVPSSKHQSCIDESLMFPPYYIDVSSRNHQENIKRMFRELAYFIHWGSSMLSPFPFSMMTTSIIHQCFQQCALDWGVPVIMSCKMILTEFWPYFWSTGTVHLVKNRNSGAMVSIFYKNIKTSVPFSKLTCWLLQSSVH